MSLSRKMGSGRLLLSLMFGALTLLILFAQPASATITEDDIGCSGSVDIRDEDGETTHIDAEDAEATIPREGRVRWRGATDGAVHNHNGEIVVDTALSDIPIDDWGDENGNDETNKRGTKEMPAVLKWIPPGTYLVAGSHSGEEGSCAGELEVTLEGGAIDLVYKVGVPVLTGLALLGLISAGKPRG